MLSYCVRGRGRIQQRTVYGRGATVPLLAGCVRVYAASHDCLPFVPVPVLDLVDLVSWRATAFLRLIVLCSTASISMTASTFQLPRCTVAQIDLL